MSSLVETARVGNDPFYKPDLVNAATPEARPDAPDNPSLRTTSPISHVIEKVAEKVNVSLKERGHVLVADPKTGEVQEMSREELRKQYEDEEIDRFLRVFSRQVQEVQAPQELPPEIPRKDDKIPCDIAMPLKDEPAFDEDDEEEWHIEPEGSLISGGLKQIAEDPKGAADAAATEITENANMAAQVALEQSEHTHTLLKEGNWRGRSPAEYIVMEWIVPYLPRPHRKTYQFTLGDMQETMTRVYLACQPLYAPFFSRMWSLMTWENPRRSFLYCVLFWVLWFFDLLMPVFLARICFSLVRRRIWPYPTTDELIERRHAEARASAVGDRIHAYLDSNVSKGIGLKDTWAMFRIATRNKKSKAKSTVQTEIQKQKDVPSGGQETTTEEDFAREDENMRRFGLALLEEVADMHERFANLIHWRDPFASTRYAIILAVMVLIALYVPHKYVVKGLYAGGGFIFWFAPNLWMALPVEHRSRIPPPLGDVPTDAEYAMKIIGERVDRGETVLPPELRKQKDKKTMSTSNLSTSGTSTSSSPVTSLDTNRSAAMIGSQTESPTSGFPGKDKPQGVTAKMANIALVDQSKRKETLDENGKPLREQTYPAKYHMSMGMLSITPSALLFYPMMTSKPKVTIPFQDIRGVKKAGRMGGLKIKYVVKGEEPTTSQSVRKYGEELDKVSGRSDSTPNTVASAVNGEPLDREAMFGWISGRDEVFAKLVGWGNRRWVKM